MRQFAFFFVIILVAGCDTGSQRGEYAVGGTSAEALANNAGRVSKLVGNPIDQLGTPRKLLIALIVLGGGVDAGQSSHQKYTSTQEFVVDSIEFSVVWDRRNGQMSLNDQAFNRNDGNVFVIRLTDGKPMMTQCSKIIDSSDTSDILDVAKTSIPNDSEIQELEPYPER